MTSKDKDKAAEAKAAEERRARRQAEVDQRLRTGRPAAYVRPHGKK